MHTARTARETLDFIWNNYHLLCQNVDLDFLSPENLETHVKHKSPTRPFRIAAWAARQGFFIAAWSVWEYYSRTLCQNLPNKTKKNGAESTVDWVERSLVANNMQFGDYGWFASANCFRNLIVHCGTRADEPKSKSLLERSRTAFPNIDTWPDGYATLEHNHVVALHIKIEDFIAESA